MGILIRRRLNALALVAIALLVLVPTLGSLLSRAKPCHALQHVAVHERHDDRRAPARSLQSDACDYCAILGGADLPALAVTPTIAIVSTLSADDERDAPPLAPREWTLGSRGPPRLPHAQ